jgi:hypothetical protein
VLGRDAQEPQHCLSERHHRVGYLRLVPPPPRHKPTEDGPERDQPRRVIRDNAAPDSPAQRLGERSIRKRRCGGHRPAAEHRHTPTRRLGCHNLRQPGLADPGLAHEEGHTALPAGCPPQRLVERSDLKVTSNDSGREHRFPSRLCSSAASVGGHRYIMVLCRAKCTPRTSSNWSTVAFVRGLRLSSTWLTSRRGRHRPPGGMISTRSSRRFVTPGRAHTTLLDATQGAGAELEGRPAMQARLKQVAVTRNNGG